MLNVRLYDDFQQMLEIEGSNEEVLKKFFNEMLDEQNFDLSFYQWFRKYFPYKCLGDIYICADDNLSEQVFRLKDLIKMKGYSVDEIELRKIERIIKSENEWEELIEGLTDKEIEELLEIREYLHKL